MSNFRFVRKWYIDNKVNPNNGKLERFKTFKSILQFKFNDFWMDVSIVDDEESKLKTDKDFGILNG